MHEKQDKDHCGKCKMTEATCFDSGYGQAVTRGQAYRAYLMYEQRSSE